jgi:hypothetical protein
MKANQTVQLLLNDQNLCNRARLSTPSLDTVLVPPSTPLTQQFQPPSADASSSCDDALQSPGARRALLDASACDGIHDGAAGFSESRHGNK